MNGLIGTFVSITAWLTVAGLTEEFPKSQEDLVISLVPLSLLIKVLLTSEDITIITGTRAILLSPIKVGQEVRAA